jgi:CDP-glucose 4,6-dehydratase
MNESFWNGRQVLVTGATGLLGGWLLKKLLPKRAEVIVVVRDPVADCMAAHEDLFSECTVIEGSFGDPILLRKVLDTHAPRTVFHLAAQTQVGAAWRDPVSTFETNTRGSWELLEACRIASTTQVILASSDKVYGSSNTLPHRETDPLHARFPYEVSKSCVDLIGQMYAEAYGLPVCIARCGNIFGGGDMNFARILPGLIRDTLQNRPFIIRGDGKNVRDFLYVEDAADAFLRLAECLDESPSLAGEAFNFSLSQPLSVLELVQKVHRIMDTNHLAPVLQNTPSQEIKEQYMLTQKAQEILGWSPKFGIDEALELTVSWYRQYFSWAGNQQNSDSHAVTQ